MITTSFGSTAPSPKNNQFAGRPTFGNEASDIDEPTETRRTGRLSPVVDDADYFSDRSTPAAKPRSHARRPNRTKAGVFKDMMKRYVKGGELKRDVILGSVLGMILAIGSPVAIVTIPTSIAIFNAFHIVSAAMKAFGSNPNGLKVRQMYQDWASEDRLRKADQL